MRLFIALEVPEHVRAPLDSAVEPLRSARDDLSWAASSGWHVTLAFLGEVPEGDDGSNGPIARIADTMRVAAGAAPERIDLRLVGAGRFGKRVLWTGIDDDPAGAVTELGASLQRELAGAGWDVDEKDVHPHLTLARSRSRRRGIDRRLIEDVPDVDAAWSVGECVLFESVRQPNGPNRYEARAVIPLGSV